MDKTSQTQRVADTIAERGDATHRNSLAIVTKKYDNRKTRKIMADIYMRVQEFEEMDAKKGQYRLAKIHSSVHARTRLQEKLHRRREGE